MMKYKGQTIQEILKGIPDAMNQQAESYLNSDKVRSVKYHSDECEPNEFEAFIVENEKTVFMPVVGMDEQARLRDIHCQCSNDDALCVHKISLLMAAQFMIEKNSKDYHSAKTAMLLQSMEAAMLQ